MMNIGDKAPEILGKDEQGCFWRQLANCAR